MVWKIDRKSCLLAIGLTSLPVGLPTPVSKAEAAARDPVYDAARRQGLVGEMPDGFLGFVVPPSPALRRLVQHINIKRRALYIEEALANGVTPEAFAFVAGCLAIARSKPGEKYKSPDGAWRTLGNEPPLRDSRCPQPS